MRQHHHPAGCQERSRVNGSVERLEIQTETAIEAGDVHAGCGRVAEAGTKFFDVAGDGKLIVAVQEDDAGKVRHF